jgi:hypothetical protein
MPQYEMFDAVQVPFLGDYNWIDLVENGDGSLSGYVSWTDNRGREAGDDPREAEDDGFGRPELDREPDGSFTRAFNLGGLDQNIYGNTITIP